MTTRSVTAVVPVRAGSRRMPNKNLQQFKGRPLLEHKVVQLLEFLDKNQIVVSSDSAEMLKIAERLGVQSHVRPKEYADDILGKPLGETIAFIASEVSGDHILWAQATSPLVSEGTYIAALDEYFSCFTDGYDSLISVQRVREYLRNKGGPLNYATGNGHTPSQQLPDLFRVTYGIVLAPRLDMVKWGYYYGNNPKLFEVGKIESVDIDDQVDFQVALALSNLHASNL